jgi:opacity protein-like surface antigen
VKRAYKILLTAAALAAFIVQNVPAAAANQQVYFSLRAGEVFPEDADSSASTGPYSISGKAEYDTGYFVGGAVGLGFAHNFRVGEEIGYSHADAKHDDDADASSLAFMTNLFFDFPTQGAIKPYVGVGVGGALDRLNIEGYDDSEFVFAYQARAGLAFQINPHLLLNVGYKYFATADPHYDIGGVHVKSAWQTHNIEAGLRYTY